MKYSRVIEAVFASPWAIQPEKIAAIVEFLSIKAAGQDVEFQAAAPARDVHRSGSIASVPIRGTLMQRADFFSQVSGATSVEGIGAAIRAALADEDVSAVVLDIDSPGGSVFGVQELADEIYSLRGDKPIVAVANSLAASAAYWIASAADEIVVTPSGQVGSIGVLMMHRDQSEFNAELGIKPTYIYAGEHKTEGNPHEPLSDDAQGFLQTQVDAYHERFLQGVAQGRGIDVDTVRADYGQGRVFISDQALALGMVDRVETLTDTVNRLRPVQPNRTPRLNMARVEFP